MFGVTGGRMFIRLNSSCALQKIPTSADEIVSDVCNAATVERDVHLVGSECPRSELHLAFLLVEGEVFDVDVTRAFKDGRRDPVHCTRVAQNEVG
jgi:hypothetical protein